MIAALYETFDGLAADDAVALRRCWRAAGARSRPVPT